MFVITVVTKDADVSLGKASTYEKAYAFMIRETAYNLRIACKDEFDADTKPTSPWEFSDTEMIEWAKENCPTHFGISDTHSYVEFWDRDFISMEIFDMDKLLEVVV